MKPEIVIRDVPFAEGPVWCPDGTLVISHLAPGGLRRIWPESGRSELFAKTRGSANAAQLAADGGFVVTQNGGLDYNSFGDVLDLPPGGAPKHEPVTPGIQRVTPDGNVSYVADQGFNGPNDLVVAPDGTLYFTDPGKHGASDTPIGRVFAVPPGGQPREIAGGFEYDNGIALSPDGRILVVEAQGLMWVGPDGDKEWLVEKLPGDSVGDGLSFDQEGRIYVCAPLDHVIRVLEPDGKQVDVLELGEKAIVTNCCFGGADNRTLFTAEILPGRVVAFEGLPSPGVPMTPWPG
jgi:gluconolactonase